MQLPTPTNPLSYAVPGDHKLTSEDELLIKQASKVADYIKKKYITSEKNIYNTDPINFLREIYFDEKGFYSSAAARKKIGIAEVKTHFNF